MKKTFIIVMAAMLGFMAACKKEDKAIVSSNITLPVLLAPTTGTAIAVTPADSAQRLQFKWSSTNYGVVTVLNYFVQVDVDGNNFSKKYVLGNTPADTLGLTLGSLNSKLLAGIGLNANAANAIEVRVGSAINGKDTVYSKSIKLNFTTYKEIAPDRLWIPGSYQGYSPGTAPTIPSVTTFTYEGYVYINASGDIKFTTAADYYHVNYGYTSAGVLTTNGNAGGIPIPASGYYKLNADIKGLTYSATLINSFGIIGTATPQQWNASTPMTYDATNKVWKITLALLPGALKFRANDTWDVNYGPADPNALTGTLIQTNDAVTIVTAGTYTVTIDMTQSTQKKYLYTVVKN
jgi:hypothetical protein